jgi:geranylgeranyl pyrophosphate synthase
MSTQSAGSQTTETLLKYKNLIDSDIRDYAAELFASTKVSYGEYPGEVVESFLSILTRGGKRLRGSLAMISYEMFGGQDKNVAITIARIVETLHAHILIIDDIQDGSKLRRGGKSAHIVLEDSYNAKLAESLAINGSLVGLHEAFSQLASLAVDDKLKVAAIQNINHHFIATAHGQTLDLIYPELKGVGESEIIKMMTLKTAQYSFMNPLQFGAIIAGASAEQMRFIVDFSAHAGVVFQLQDDIAGMFADEMETGKQIGEDIREGKKTLLIHKTLELCTNEEQRYLKSVLGRKKVTLDEIENVRGIIIGSGAKNAILRQIEIERLEAQKILQEIKNNSIHVQSMRAVTRVI